MFPGSDLHYRYYSVHPAQPPITAGEELDYLDHHLPDRGVGSI